MKIVTYMDLESKNSLLPLMEQAFGWPFSEREFDRFIKIDPRLRNGSVGFCAVVGQKVVSYVGVMDVATRTLDGAPEYVGGIYGVATLPGYTRQGFSTALFRAAHEYFRDKGYRFSLLNTSPILVAYSLYEKLGYSDVYCYPSAYKILKSRKAKSSKLENLTLDLDKVLGIYDKYAKGKAGFVIRDRAYLKMLMRDKRLTRKGCIYSENGYAIFKKESNSTRILELVALNKMEAERLVMMVEQKVADLVFARVVLDKAIQQAYQLHGYTLLDDTYRMFMVKPLTNEASFKQVYGEGFFQTELDHF